MYGIDMQEHDEWEWERHMSGLPSRVIDPAVFDEFWRLGSLRQHLPPLLEKLRWFECRDYGGAVGGAYMLKFWSFIPSHLMEFRFQIMPRNRLLPVSDATLRFISSLEMKCPNLECLSIFGGYADNSTFGDTVLRAARSLSNLRIFEWGEHALDRDTLIHLASLPNLRTLSANIPDTMPLAQSCLLANQRTPFPALKYLTIFSTYLPTATSLIRALSRSTMHDLTVQIDTTPSPTDVNDFFTALLNRCSRDFLNSVQVNLDHVARTGEEVKEIEKRHFFPLFQFGNLTVFCFNKPWLSTAQLDDDFLEEMALSWPKLQEIQLRSHELVFAVSQITLRGLLCLAVGCPDLQSIELSFNASVAIDWGDRPDNFVPNTSTRYLHVGQSPIRDSLAVATFLSKVFPRLDSIMVDEDGLLHYGDLERSTRWWEAFRLYQGNASSDTLSESGLNQWIGRMYVS